MKMAQWESKSDLFGGLKGSLETVQSTIVALNNVISIIDQFNALISTQVSIINTLAVNLIPDLTRVTLQLLQQNILDYLANFRDAGVYLLPVIPNTKFDISAFESVSGGYQAFKQRTIQSFYDIYDAKRPTFGNSATVGALVVVIDSSNVDEIIKGLSVFNKLLNFNQTVSTNLAPIVDLTAVSGNKELLLVWDLGKGQVADNFVIDRTLWNGEEPFQTSVPISNSILRYRDIGLENGVQYKYTITPQYLGVSASDKSGSVSGTPLSITGDGNQNTLGLRACTNLTYEMINEVATRRCALNNPNFYIDNPNGIKCQYGSILCDNYNNRNCKYNVNDGFVAACTSTGFTINKTAIETEGIAQPIPNTSFYDFYKCQRGYTACVCDGFTELVTSRTGAPPNWENISVQRLLPADISNLLNSFSSFIVSLTQKTVKDDVGRNYLGELIQGTVTNFKDILREMRDLLLNINDLLSIASPGMYLLEIPPGSGGNDYFISAFENALEEPISGPGGYTIGFVLMFGGDAATVGLSYSIWKTFLSV
jgi:hypothetical protein